jgi:hypothetical protein
VCHCRLICNKKSPTISIKITSDDNKSLCVSMVKQQTICYRFICNKIATISMKIKINYNKKNYIFASF